MRLSPSFAMGVRQLLRSFPDLQALGPLAEATDSGAEFLKTLSGFFGAEAENADRVITVRRAEIAELRQDIGKLQAQIDAKRRLAAEKIRDQKERVRSTQAFYERLGVSRALATLQPILARISPMSPLTLPDGTVVSSIDLATLKITSARTPGAGGADDFRTQALFAEIMNVALGGDQHEPINFTEGDVFMRELEQIEPVPSVMASVETTRQLRMGQDHDVADTRQRAHANK